MAFDIETISDQKDEAFLYKIALGMLDGIGPVRAKKLVAYCGGAQAVFKESKGNLQKIPTIGPQLSASIADKEVLALAEREIEFITKHNIRSYFFLDDEYPTRLKHCADGPIMLYSKGKINLDAARVVSIVGTRKATAYGKKLCEELVEGIAEHEDALVVSGLAYGVDICAHKAALKYGVPTVAVLAHGLDTIYPALHRETAKAMMRDGGLLTELTSGNKPEKNNFPQRNRVVAGLADATIVVESGRGGGSMITANLANSYNRDVLAVPGRATDKYSQGCNLLIKSHRAAVVESIADLEYVLGWDKQSTSPVIQARMFEELDPNEKLVCEFLKENPETQIDVLCHQLELTPGEAASMLLNLEFRGLVKALPGKRFSLG